MEVLIEVGLPKPMPQGVCQPGIGGSRELDFYLFADFSET